MDNAMTRNSPALEWARERIAWLKRKTDANCDLDTYYHRVQTIGTVIGTLVSTLTLQLSAKQVFLPTWASVGLTAFVLLVGAYMGYGSEMVKKHKYNERWCHMRPVLDDMIKEERLATFKTGDYLGKTDAEIDDLLSQRIATLMKQSRDIVK